MPVGDRPVRCAWRERRRDSPAGPAIAAEGDRAGTSRSAGRNDADLVKLRVGTPRMADPCRSASSVRMRRCETFLIAT